MRNTKSTHRTRLMLQERLIKATAKWFHFTQMGCQASIIYFRDKMNLLEKEILILRKEKIN
tara:strand:+ start:81 stop:263 length:183 start_codon:yes stop_codon:yes gene_type:complete